MLHDLARATVGVGDRLRRVTHRIRARPRAHVGEVDEHPTAVHLVDHVPPEVRQPPVARLPAPAADQVLRVVGELHHSYPEVAEQLDELGPILQRGGVLPAKDDAGAPLALRAPDIGNAVHLEEQVVVLPKPPLPLRDVLHGGPEPFPHRTGAVRGGHPARAHLLEHVSAPVRDDQSVDQDRVVVQFGRGHHATFGFAPFNGP